jgi:hypothetical protein
MIVHKIYSLHWMMLVKKLFIVSDNC